MPTWSNESNEHNEPNLFNTFNQQIIEEFRSAGGKVGGPFEGGDLLLLTTTGARSGAEHTVPLGFVRDGDLLLVVASAGGADRHPAWYHNLLARPRVRVEVGSRTFEAVATPAAGERRDRLFALVTRAAPGYATYQSGTARILPVVVLERSRPDPDTRPEPAADTRTAGTLAGKLLEVHTWLRGQLVEVRAEAEEYFAARAAGAVAGAPPVPGLGLQLRRHCLEFCEALEFHHTAEDAHVFPGLANAYPHLADTLNRLRDEHRTVARIQSELLTLLTGIETTDQERFLGQLDRMSEELRTHLAHEEESLLPVLTEIPFPA